MRLSIPTNWDDKLIENLSGLSVHSYYARLKDDVIGGGRPSGSLPEVTREKAKEHVKLIHANKSRFNYVINAPCLGNNEYAPAFSRQIFELFDWLVSIETDSVTVTIPLLIEWIKKYFPSLKVTASVFAQVNNVNMAKMYESLGADEITLPQQFNRDFGFLKSFRKNCKAELQLIANNICLYGCPFRTYHTNLTCHSSQTGAARLPLDYSLMQCTLLRFKQPAEIIRSPWVRPEDAGHYEKIGIDKFKLAGRTNTTEWITRTAKAYAAGKSPKNFAELVSDPNGSCCLFRRPVQSSLEVPLVIDNDELDGFIDRFLEKSCATLSCGQCLYCDKVAEKSVKIDKKLADRLIAGYEKFLSDFHAGAAKDR